MSPSFCSHHNRSCKVDQNKLSSFPPFILPQRDRIYLNPVIKYSFVTTFDRYFSSVRTAILMPHDRGVFEGYKRSRTVKNIHIQSCQSTVPRS